MVAVPPDRPVTIPVLLILATVVSLLDHVPPPAASARVVVVPSQIVVVPVMVPAEGPAEVVTDNVALAVPQALVTV